MQHFIQRTARRTVLAVALGMIGGTMLGSAQASNLKIRVATTAATDVGSAAMYYALKTGAFAKAGLDIEAQPFIQSSQKYDAFKAGAVDIDITMNSVVAAQLHGSGVPIVVVRATQTADMWAVMVKADSPISKPADLKGKKFGVVSLSGTNYATSYFAFKVGGVDLMRDMKVSTMPPSVLLSALDRGDVDGITLYDPFVTSAVKSGRAKVLARTGEVYEKHYKEPFVAITISANKGFYTKNKAAVAKFVSVMETTLADLDKNIDPASAALSEGIPELKLTPAEAKETLQFYTKNYVRPRNEPVFLKKIQNMYDRLYEIKQFKEPVKAAEFWVNPF